VLIVIELWTVMSYMGFMALELHEKMEDMEVS